jgi:N-formylglutamate amidohydrolase
VKLPLLLSVPHAGWRIPDVVVSYCVLSQDQIDEDGDVGAHEIYNLESEVVAYVTTDVARAIVDLNRAEDDRRADGVVKTHTCWNVPIYCEPLPESIVQGLIERHYHPYHRKLRDLAGTDIRLAIDCHTMAAKGPPVGPDPGQERPRVCLSHAGETCPDEWIESLRDCFEESIGGDVRINEPFTGGFITRSHSREIPWVQLELSRAPFMSNDEKRKAVLQALRDWCS